MKKTLLVLALALIGIATIRFALWPDIEHGLVSFDIAPSGKQIAFSSAGGDLFQMDLKSKHLKRLTASREIETSPQYSPDGKFLVFTREDMSAQGSNVWILSLGDGKFKRLTRDAKVSDMEASFGQDGKTIVFTRAFRHRPYSMGGWTWDKYDIMIMSVDGTQLRQLTRKGYYQATSPIQTSNGTLYAGDGADGPLFAVAFTVKSGGMPTPALGNPSKNLKIGSWTSDLEASNDGNKIAFLSDRKTPYHYDIYVTDYGKQTARAMNVTNVSTYNGNPRFMPDNRSILYLAGTERNMGSRAIFSLYQVNAGAAPLKVADSLLFTDPLEWEKKQRKRSG